jgi:hypothetical protein
LVRGASELIEKSDFGLQAGDLGCSGGPIRAYEQCAKRAPGRALRCWIRGCAFEPVISPVRQSRSAIRGTRGCNSGMRQHGGAR